MCEGKKYLLHKHTGDLPVTVKECELIHCCLLQENDNHGCFLSYLLGFLFSVSFVFLFFFLKFIIVVVYMFEMNKNT